jgi:hypothetical protein
MFQQRRQQQQAYMPSHHHPTHSVATPPDHLLVALTFPSATYLPLLRFNSK